MKLVIPSEGAEGLAATRSGHFGHAAYFTIVDIDDAGQINSVESLKNVDPDAVGCGGVIDFVISQGVDAILTVGMGMPPFTRFTNAGVAVYSERETPNVGDVVARFARGEVARMDPSAACRH
jgi:predicted Fe-Mo cluster-binding NifX family protein